MGFPGRVEAGETVWFGCFLVGMFVGAVGAVLVLGMTVMQDEQDEDD